MHGTSLSKTDVPKPGKKLVAFSGEMFKRLLTQGNVISAVCLKGLPANARFLGLQYDAMSDRWILAFESPDWPEVAPGLIPEQIEVLYESLPVTQLEIV